MNGYGVPWSRRGGSASSIVSRLRRSNDSNSLVTHLPLSLVTVHKWSLGAWQLVFSGLSAWLERMKKKLVSLWGSTGDQIDQTTE